MDIPRKIKVGDKWYSVEVVEAMQEHGHMGEVNYPKQKIKVSTKSNVTRRKYSKDTVHDTFWHELIHAILHDMGRHRLNNDEEFVHGVSSRLYKAISTARF